MNGCVIPHTPIAVDFWKIRECPQVRIFFLTHLHGDHTAGLTSSWRYPIYCSEITGRLLIHNYGIKRELINILQVNCASIIYLDSIGCQQMTVTALDANHCPGAVMFLMESYFGTILHTGDFRFQPEMLQNPTLSQYAGSIDILYLDNTYCSPGCEFPSREQATKAIIKIIKDHPLHNILIAMRNFGKEELLCRIAKHFKDWISVPTKLYNILEILGAPDMFDNSSTNHRIRTVSFTSVSREFVKRVNAVSPTIVIIPTALFCGLDHRPYDNEENVFVVPYSDHSSFKELEEFVAFVKPKKIIPIVKATARGPFGASIVNRADMSCFRNIVKDDRNKKVEIPISVQAFMNVNGINMVLRCGKGVKRKKMKLSKSWSGKRMKKGIIYESTESASSETSENSHKEETYNTVCEHINESAKGNSLESSVSFKEHPNTPLKYKIDTCVKDEQKKLEQHTLNEQLCSRQDTDNVDNVKNVEHTEEETDAIRTFLDFEDSKFDKVIIPKTSRKISEMFLSTNFELDVEMKKMQKAPKKHISYEGKESCLESVKFKGNSNSDMTRATVDVVKEDDVKPFSEIIRHTIGNGQDLTNRCKTDSYSRFNSQEYLIVGSPGSITKDVRERLTDSHLQNALINNVDAYDYQIAEPNAQYNSTLINFDKIPELLKNGCVSQANIFRNVERLSSCTSEAFGKSLDVEWETQQFSVQENKDLTENVCNKQNNSEVYGRKLSEVLETSLEHISSSASLEVEPGTTCIPADGSEGLVDVEPRTRHFPAKDEEGSLEVEPATHYFPAEEYEGSLEVETGTQYFAADENEDSLEAEPETEYFPGEENEGSLETELGTRYFPAENNEDSLEVEPGTQHFSAEEYETSFKVEPGTQHFPAEEYEGLLDDESGTRYFPAEEGGDSLEVVSGTQQIPAEDDTDEQFIARKLVIDKSDENEVCASDEVIEKNCRLFELNAFKQVFKMRDFSIPAERNLVTCNIGQPIETVSKYFYSLDCDKNVSKCSQINILSTEKQTVSARRRKLNQIFSRI